MSLKLKKKKVTKIPPIEGGTYMAICVGVIDVGEQYNQNFKNYSDKLMLLFEIPDETVDVDGEQKPRWLSKEYTASLNEKAKLYKDLVSWRAKPFSEEELDEEGDGFDVRSMAGKACMLTVIIREGKSGTYNQIEGISPMPKGLPSPKSDSEVLIFDIDDRDEAVLKKLPEWIQKKIKSSTQYAENLPEQKLDFPEENEEEECPI
jgi:hypothetical protein